MKKLFFFLILIAALLIPNSFCFAQNKNIDSLLTLLKTDKADTNKVKHSYKLCWEYKNIGLYDTALYYGNTALQLAQQLNFKKGIANSYSGIGNVYFRQGNYPDALKNHFASLRLQKAIGNKQGIAASYNNIGNVYDSQGNYPDALKNHFASLKIREVIGDKQGIATSYSNIGLVYFSQGNYPDALQNYFASLKIREVLGIKQDIATCYNNIGNVYYMQGNYPDALKNHFASLKIKEGIGDKEGIANSYNNIGAVYRSQGNYPDALKNNFASLQLSEAMGDKNGVASSYINIGAVYIKQKKYKEAQKYLMKAKIVSKDIGSKEYIKDSYSRLADADSAMGNWKAAYENHKLFILYKDSIDNEQTRKKTIQSTMQYEFDTKETAAQAEQDKKDAVQQSEAKREKLIRYSVIAGLLLMFIVSFIIFRSLRITRRQKNIIELQKDEVSKQKDIAEELRELSENQKHIVEEKQKEIIQSITYAKRIQTALLTSDKYINTHLPAEHFILFKPKDIVSGDFYWAYKSPSRPPQRGGESTHQVMDSADGKVLPFGEDLGGASLFYMITADCTGHGVPGAFMSMLNISYLNENIVERSICLPHDILNAQRKEIIQALNPEGSITESKDGMDCILCAYDFDKMLLHFASANNPLWLIREKSSEFKVENSELTESNSKLNTQNFELIEYKADKMPVGKYSEKMEPFTLNTIELQKGDIIYTSTDGFADQFGTNGKKLMKKKFKEELLKIHHLPMSEQKEYLDNFFENWKENLEQVDDVCVIGVKI